MTPRDIRNTIFGTLRGRLILGVAVVHAVLMTLFVIDLTLRQRTMLLEHQEEDAAALSRALSTSAASWLAARDIAGLQEMVEAQRRYPELTFALLADEGGRILAHTDSSRKGLYLLDLPAEVSPIVIHRSSLLVDVAVPALLGGRHVGWARVGLGQVAAGERVAAITRSGALYALAAIVVGSLIAWLMGSTITRRLYAVQETINKVRSGDHLARATVTGTDEAAAVAREFNATLDTLAERDRELRDSQEVVKTVLDSIDAIVYVADMETYELLYINQTVKELFGEVTGQLCWQSIQTGQSGPCPFCTNHYLLDPGGNPADVYRWEFRNTVNGHWYDVRDRAIPWKVGQLVRMEIATDITDRKEAEEAWRQSTEVVERIFSMTTTCIAYLDRDFNFIRVNQEYAAGDDKTPDDFLGRNHFALYPHPENEAIFRKVVVSGEQHISHAKPFTYKDHPERGVSYWDWSLTPVKDSQGVVEALILSLVNVSERVKAQEELKLLNEGLEQRVRERTAELEAKNAELERLNKLFVGRELRMIELKERIKELEPQGRLPKA